MYLHYGPRYAQWVQADLQGAAGELLVQARGPGPRNVMVRLNSGKVVVVPRRNVRRHEMEVYVSERGGRRHAYLDCPRLRGAKWVKRIIVDPGVMDCSICRRRLAREHGQLTIWDLRPK